MEEEMEEGSKRERGREQERERGREEELERMEGKRDRRSETTNKTTFNTPLLSLL